MPFFKHTIIDDEKWIVYHIVERKQSKGNWDESPRTTPKKKNIQNGILQIATFKCNH